MMSPEHISHPYPSEQEKAEIMAKMGIELKQQYCFLVYEHVTS
jgi:hypothetical protein